MSETLDARPGAVDVERAIEDLVYEHLIDLVDFERVGQLERVVAAKLAELAERDPAVNLVDEMVEDRANALLGRAWRRLFEDPRRYCDFIGDWQADEACELCRALAEEEVAPVRHPRV